MLDSRAGHHHAESPERHPPATERPHRTPGARRECEQHHPPLAMSRPHVPRLVRDLRTPPSVRPRISRDCHLWGISWMHNSSGCQAVPEPGPPAIHTLERSGSEMSAWAIAPLPPHRSGSTWCLPTRSRFRRGQPGSAELGRKLAQARQPHKLASRRRKRYGRTTRAGWSCGSCRCGALSQRPLPAALPAALSLCRERCP